MPEQDQKPAIAAPVWENVPPELASRQQWLLWKFEPPDKPGRKWRKMPYYVGGGRRAGTQGDDRDRQRLATLEVVRRAFDRGGFDGVGFAFLEADGLIGVDIDGALDDDGAWSDRCMSIVRSCPGTFVEISPSGRGVHIYGAGTTHTNKHDSIGLEIFCGSQFFTVTGRLWDGAARAIAPLAPMVLDGLHAMVDRAKELARAARSAPQQSSPPARAGSSPPASSGDFFKTVNVAAMQSLAAWVPQLIPQARPYKQGYRATSKDLGRELEEDLAIHPDGIRDFGLEESYTPVDLVLAWLPGASRAIEAATWLAERLGIQVPAPPSQRRIAPVDQDPRATSQAAAGSGSGDEPPEGRFPPADAAYEGEGKAFADLEAFDTLYSRLLKGKGGKFEDCRENVEICLQLDPALKGVVARNLFTELQDKRRAPPWGGELGEWTEEDDLQLGKYLALTHGLLLRSPPTIRAGVQMAARDHKYHPVLEELRRTEWDRKERLDTWLSECLGAPDRPYVRLVSRFFIMGMCARLLRPGSKFDYMLILQGGQGLGKSSAFRILGGDYFMDTPFRIGDKDSYLSLQGVWLVEFSELEAMSKSESTAIKAFVTSPEDRFRPPYGTRMVKMPRRAVLAGTTNADTFLKDATGERRFWPVHVTKVDQDRLREIRDQLFAEALHRLEDLEADPERRRYYPTRAEEAELFHPEQDKWRMVDVWTDILQDYLERTSVPGSDLSETVPPSKRGFFSAQELFEKALGIKAERMDNGRLMQTRVANAMKELGYASTREPQGARKRGYMRPGWEFHDGRARKIPAPQADSSTEPGEDDVPF